MESLCERKSQPWVDVSVDDVLGIGIHGGGRGYNVHSWQEKGLRCERVIEHADAVISDRRRPSHAKVFSADTPTCLPSTTRQCDLDLLLAREKTRLPM